MTEVGTFEAKNRLSELVSQAERGEIVHITRRGVRVAALVPPGAEILLSGSSKERPSITEGFCALRDGAQTGDASIKEMIEEGRR